MESMIKHMPMVAQYSLSRVPNVDDSLARSRGQNPYLRSPLATSGWLFGLNGFHTGEDFRLYPGKNTIGASTRSDLIITGPDVSRQHATIDVLSGESAILHPGYTNKILQVNGVHCLTPTPLCHADLITIGSQSFSYVSLLCGGNEVNTPIRLRQNPAKDAQITAGWLIEVKGEREGRDYRLKFGENRVGSQCGLEVVLSSEDVPARHAVITRHDSNWTIVPVSVTEPLSINGILSTGDVLRNADVLTIGGSEFIFRSLNIEWAS